MKSISKGLAKGTIAAVAAGAMAMAASPANAQWRDRDRDRDDIDVGDVIAGAVIIGGIAAAISAIDGDNDRYRGRGDYRYRGGSARNAVEQCVYAAERNANRYSWGGNAQVTDIRKVDRDRDGYEIKGRIAVNQMGRDWRRGDRRYGRGWDNDYRGWNDRYRGWDSGKFECKIRYGRVVDLDYSGIRGL